MKIPYLIILFAVSLLGSCNIMDDEVCSGQSSPITAPVQIGFTLTTGDVSSRAITEETEAGTGYENYIDIASNDFRILLFDATDDTYLTTFIPTNIRPTDNTEYLQTYYVEGELEEAYTNFKLVVLANWGENAYPKAETLTSQTTIKDICDAASATYTYDREKNLIPMYGVHTYNKVGWRANLLTTLDGEVDLLRAMAKIEVKCTAEDIKLTGVKLHRYNTTGYCAPSDVDSDTQDDWGYDDNTVCNHTTHIPNDVLEETELTFTPNPQEENSYIVYVPEFDNTDNGERNYIEVNLQRTDGADVTLTSDPYIYFCEYDENGKVITDTDFDIVRNHWYSYDITQVDDGKLLIRYKALPWNVMTSSIGYLPEPASLTKSPFSNETEFNSFIEGDNYILLPLKKYDDNHQTTQDLFNHLFMNPEDGDNEARLCILTRPTYNNEKTHNDLKTGSAGARYYFMLTGPEGATWTAHLSNKEDFAFSNSVTEDFKNAANEGYNKEVKMVTHGIAREQPYIIQIIARHLYTGYEEGMSGETTEKGFNEDGYEDKGISDSEWSSYFNDKYLTIWGQEKWESQKVVETEFYITVKLKDGTEYELLINPSYNLNPNQVSSKDFPFKDCRRYAGTGTRIWIRQLRAQYKWPNLEYLARDWQGHGSNNAEEWENSYWWNVNPYWNPDHDESVWK